MEMSILARGTVFLIRGYQRFLSPFLGARCRFYPTCSQYAILVIAEWGFFRGALLMLRRLVKCGPWHEGGYDPPPCRNGAGKPREIQRKSNLKGNLKDV